jgi:phage terminase small subunit
MARGRKPLSDAIKALKGNPGKRKLLLDGKEQAPDKIVKPDFVSGAQEKRMFEAVVKLASRFIRNSDSFALGRYAYYLSRWAENKKRLKNEDDFYETSTKHGDMLRKHPGSELMLKYEIALLRLEDRLGLSPAARMTIAKGMLLGQSQLPLPLDGEQPQQPDQMPSPSAAIAPIGFLNQASKTIQ